MVLEIVYWQPSNTLPKSSLVRLRQRVGGKGDGEDRWRTICRVYLRLKAHGLVSNFLGEVLVQGCGEGGELCAFEISLVRWFCNGLSCGR